MLPKIVEVKEWIVEPIDGLSFESREEAAVCVEVISLLNLVTRGRIAPTRSSVEHWCDLSHESLCDIKQQLGRVITAKGLVKKENDGA